MVLRLFTEIWIQSSQRELMSCRRYILLEVAAPAFQVMLHLNREVIDTIYTT